MSDKVKQAIADGAWQLLQHFVCQDYKTSQRGAGGVHSRHNAHRLYPKNMTEFVKQPPDTPKEKCDGKFKIKMASPAQATVEQGKSEGEAKQLRETTQGKAPQSSTTRPRGQNSVKPKKKKRKYNGTVFQNGVF